ncbi:Conserved_hypothetical protein [Hexamita inflata]|uniref:ISXO2-like transposase domain-containing protein n=1 Tax=Hexamita inflata TaxID=28002 RepID=A0ABP1M7I7_9EUKA
MSLELDYFEELMLNKTMMQQIQNFQKQNLLPKTQQCLLCSCNCILIVKNVQFVEKGFWLCQNCNYEINIFANTVFSKVQHIWKLVPYYAMKFISDNNYDILEEQHKDVYFRAKSTFKSIMTNILRMNRIVLGGAGTIIEVAEFNYNERNIIGFAQRSSKLCKFIVLHKNDDILRLIQKYILPGATIYTTQKYEGISQIGYKHVQIVKNQKIIDPTIHLQTIKGVWSRAKFNTDGIHPLWRKNLQNSLDLFAISKYYNEMKQQLWLQIIITIKTDLNNYTQNNKTSNNIQKNLQISSNLNGERKYIKKVLKIHKSNDKTSIFQKLVKLDLFVHKQKCLYTVYCLYPCSLFTYIIIRLILKYITFPDVLRISHFIPSQINERLNQTQVLSANTTVCLSQNRRKRAIT